MKPILDESGSLATRVETYFPPGTGVLIVRRDHDNVELQLVQVDQAGRVMPLTRNATQNEQGLTGFDAHNREVGAGDRHFQGFVVLERRTGFFKRAAHFLNRLIRRPLQVLQQIFKFKPRGVPPGGHVEIRYVHGGADSGPADPTKSSSGKAPDETHA